MKNNIDKYGWLIVALLILTGIILSATACTDKAEAEPITGPVCLECERNNPGGPPLPDMIYDTCFQDVQQANNYVLKMKHNFTECRVK
jgi:hypothetical protein